MKRKEEKAAHAKPKHPSAAGKHIQQPVSSAKRHSETMLGINDPQKKKKAARRKELHGGQEVHAVQPEDR